MSHDELIGMAAGYALSALDPDDLSTFEAHLASCPECTAAVAEMRPLVGALSMLSEPVEPSRELRQRILESARAEPIGPEATAQAMQKKKAPLWRRPVFWPLPVAAVVTVLAIVIAVVSIWGSQANSDLASADRRQNITYEGLEIMAQAEQWWRFDGSAITAGVDGTLAYSQEFGAACLLIWGLEDSDDLRYRVRLTDADGEVTVRRMWRYDNAMWLIFDGDPSLLRKLEVIGPASDPPAASESAALIDIPLTPS